MAAGEKESRAFGVALSGRRLFFEREFRGYAHFRKAIAYFIVNGERL